MSWTSKNLLLWMVAAGTIFVFWSVSSRIQREERYLSFSDFLAALEDGQVARVTLVGSEGGTTISGELVNGLAFRTFVPPQFDNLVYTLLDKGVEVNARDAGSTSWENHLVSWAPIVIVVAFLIVFGRFARGTPDLATMNRIWEGLAARDEDLSLDELSAKLSFRNKTALRMALFQMIREKTVVFTSQKKYRVAKVE